jgi:PAS domain S-box-containing protein
MTIYHGDLCDEPAPMRDGSFFRALIENSRDAVVVADATGLLIYQSPGTYHQLGYRPDDCLGRHVLEFIHPADAPVLLQALEHAHRQPGTTHGMEVRLRTGSGTWCWVEGRATNMLHVPAIRGVVLNTIVIENRKALELRNAAAKLDPHFHYNVLHSVACMIQDGQSDEAIEAIVRLRELTAGHIAAADDRLIPLSAEWSWVRDYLALEQLRFGHRLHVSVLPLSGTLGETPVPCRIVQPLAENAIRHGIEERPGGGALRIESELHDGCVSIIVSESGQPRPQRVRSAPGLGIGSETTHRRLQLHFGEAASLTLQTEPTSSRAVLKIPLLYA